MAAVLLHRRGVTAVRTAYTPQISELFYDITLKELFVGDGTTAGGVLVSVSTILTSLADGDILVYDSGSSSWKNRRPKHEIVSPAVVGVLTASQQLMYYRFPKAVTIPANFGGSYLGSASQAGGTANATASTVINVDQAPNATPNTFSNVGTITIAAGTVTPTFATAGGSPISFAEGDVVRIMGPGSADATFAGFYATLIGFET